MFLSHSFPGKLSPPTAELSRFQTLETTIGLMGGSGSGSKTEALNFYRLHNVQNHEQSQPSPALHVVGTISIVSCRIGVGEQPIEFTVGAGDLENSAHRPLPCHGGSNNLQISKL